MKQLVNFHSIQKLLLLGCNQAQMRILGRIVANADNEAFDGIVTRYEEHLKQALATPPRFTAMINVLEHAFGGFSKVLSKEEKAFSGERRGIQGRKDTFERSSQRLAGLVNPLSQRIPPGADPAAALSGPTGRNYRFRKRKETVICLAAGANTGGCRGPSSIFFDYETNFHCNLELCDFAFDDPTRGFHHFKPPYIVDGFVCRFDRITNGIVDTLC